LHDPKQGGNGAQEQDHGDFAQISSLQAHLGLAADVDRSSAGK
jgi:hypothetical protein